MMIFSLFLTIFFLRFNRNRVRRHRVLFARKDKLIEHIRGQTEFMRHTEDFGVLNLDNVRINLFVSLL